MNLTKQKIQKRRKLHISTCSVSIKYRHIFINELIELLVAHFYEVQAKYQQ